MMSWFAKPDSIIRVWALRAVTLGAALIWASA